MKKWISVLLAAVLTLCLCAGCGGSGGESQAQGNDAAGQDGSSHGDTDAGKAPSGIYYELTGIAPGETVMTVDGNQIPMELYCYWAVYNCSYLDYQLGLYNAYYGLYAENFTEEGSLDWNTPFMEEGTLSQFARQQTEENIKYVATVENMAARYGVTLTEEDKAAMDQSRADATEELGGEEAFLEQLELMGLSQEGFDRVAAVTYLFDHLKALVTEEGSPLYLPPERYDEYATYADHILLATVDLTTQEPLGEEEAAAKYALAQDLLSQLQAAGDVETLFAQLADEYSEDTGRAANPEGYIYTPGTMVAEFESAASALEPGQISGMVETEYGYHILLRKDLREGLKENAEMLDTVAEAHLTSLLNQALEQAETTTGNQVADFDMGSFYTRYNQKVEAASASKEETGGEAGEAAGASGEEAGGTTSQDGTGTAG